jgi:dTDP-4-amino-4,6-dideoxygalactose transaminase
LLTTSCTDALEMCAILVDIKPGDEVIVPSYTFVSTALGFVRQGARIVFADSQSSNPNIDADKIEDLITSRTKAIAITHYAGIACEMDKLVDIAKKYNLLLIEDAAQAIDSYYISPKTDQRRALGSIGNLATFSFHETKNIISGEGGMLVINDERFIHRAEIIWEKGTNRAEFFRGEINKYGWVDIGSSFLPSEIIAAYLWAQIEHLDDIQIKRKSIWNSYYEELQPLADKNFVFLPEIPSYATNNAHMFYLVCKSLEDRTKLIEYLKENDISAVFHYISLHKSNYYKDKHDGRELIYCDRFTDCLLRLPLFYELKQKEIGHICSILRKYYNYST